MAEQRLETFLQVSDLHIGEFDAAGNAITPAYWAKWRRFEGFLGHHFRALRALSKFFDRLRQTENAKLVVTGDLTACGAHEQFRDATLFLGGRLPKHKTGLGLEAPNWATAGIPGNHDHWPGTNNVFFGRPTPGLDGTFPQIPFVKTLPRLSTGHAITFMFINSDADVGTPSLHRIYAMGHFTSELHKLGDILQDPLPNEVRVLVLHHSRCYVPQGRVPSLRMSTPSRMALDDFLLDKNIQILMTGHIHRQHVDKYSVQNAHGQSLDFLECRCGTTTVRNTVPPTWRNLWGQFPKWQLPPNTAIVHRIVQDGTQVQWKAEEYLLQPAGFARLNPPRVKTLPIRS